METVFETLQRNSFILRKFDDYKEFMGVNTLPTFEILPVNISLEKAERRGYGDLASHKYDVKMDKHTITVWKDLFKNVFHAEYLLFHEFTHLYDTVTYAAGNKYNYAMIRGYTEYHAAQVDLLKLLDAESIETPISFSFDQSFETITGRKTVLKYIEESHDTAKNIITRPDFPDSMETLITGLGLAFNYLGRLSISKMYAIDYSEYAASIEDTSVEKRVFGDYFAAIETILRGFPKKREVIKIGQIYLNMVNEMMPKIKVDENKGYNRG